MKRLFIAMCSLALGSGLMSATAGAATVRQLPVVGNARQAQPGIMERMGAHQMYNVVPEDIDRSQLHFDRRGELIGAAKAPALPLWQASFTDAFDGNNYTIDLVGALPQDPVVSKIGTYVLAYKFKFANGVVLDATKPACNETVPVTKRFLDSPIFVPQDFVSNGVDVGSRQYIDAFVAAEFYGFAAPTYHLEFKHVAADDKTVMLTVPSSDGEVVSVTGCGNVGLINQAWFDQQNRAVITKLALPHNLVPFSLFNDTYMYNGTPTNCCVIGYHSGYGDTSFAQYYGVGAYAAAGLFKGLDDVAALTHELAELVDDPSGANATPAWGHTGQVSGCQGNFEVGDPLSGTEFTATSGGQTFHLQDLAFFSWFYRGTSANQLYFGTGGAYSFLGTFTQFESTVCT